MESGQGVISCLIFVSLVVLFWKYVDHIPTNKL